MQIKAKGMAAFLPTGRSSERGINRLKLIGISALLLCIGIAAYGLGQQQTAIAVTEDAQTHPWTPQR